MTRPASATGKRGGRRPKEYEEYDHVTLSEEERDKRDKRRLRNKEAAARCRQRRLDLMGSLQNQVNQLKEENKMKDAKIAELQLLPSSMQIKQEPTLFDVNGRDLPDEEIKRPTSLTFADGVTTTTTYSSLSSSGVPITTPSNLIGGATSDFGGVNLLDGPTGLTPCHPPQATAFQLPSMTAPLGEGRSFETL
uniref:BZIP domain-containing protein n=1 Tax=Elaeophora elaphi TaxID=1147741 RepID=A0A0R3S6W2_9BILA